MSSFNANRYREPNSQVLFDPVLLNASSTETIQADVTDIQDGKQICMIDRL